MREEWECERRRLQQENQHLQHLLADRRTNSPSPAPEGFLNQPQLFDLLNLGSRSPEGELQRVISAGRTQSLALQSRAVWLLRSSRLQRWLNSPNSDAVLIHGNSDAAKISPVSLFCALLVQSLVAVEPARVVHFFCGIHSAPQDPLTGAQGLLRSLIGQLLCQDQYKLAFLTRRDIHRIKTNELGALQELFANLVMQLGPGTALFCVLDGINFYETDEHAMYAGSVFTQILNLVRADESRAVVKFLVTSPSRTRLVGEAFPAENQVAVPRIMTKEGYELNGRRFVTATGESLEQLVDGLSGAGGEAAMESEELVRQEQNK
jgi:hypothetical protein